jgi:glutamine synthetase
LFEGDVNAFHDPGDNAGLSKVGKCFIAGLLRHAPEITAVTNQWVNSYKRLATGFEAPQAVCWTRQVNGALVRVPSNRPGKESAARIELRSPDPACNPYLVFALVLAAGLDGIETNAELPPEAAGESLDGYPRLPEDLGAATDLFESSELARTTLGDRLCEWFVANKRQEWSEYRATVTEYERRRYLRLL